MTASDFQGDYPTLEQMDLATSIYAQQCEDNSWRFQQPSRSLSQVNGSSVHLYNVRGQLAAIHLPQDSEYVRALAFLNTCPSDVDVTEVARALPHWLFKHLKGCVSDALQENNDEEVQKILEFLVKVMGRLKESAADYERDAAETLEDEYS